MLLHSAYEVTTLGQYTTEVSLIKNPETFFASGLFIKNTYIISSSRRQVLCKYLQSR
jgi:hypothetical protein